MQTKLQLLRCFNSTTTTKSPVWKVLHQRYASSVNRDHNYCHSGDYDHGKQLIHVICSTDSKLKDNEISQVQHIKKITLGLRGNPLWHQHCQYGIPSSLARKVLHSTEVGKLALINKIMKVQPVSSYKNIPLLCYMELTMKHKPTRDTQI